MNERQLDIILINADEPDLGHAPFLEMMAMQRDVDFSKVCVLLFHNREEDELPDPGKYPFTLKQRVIPDATIGDLRNCGINTSSAKWITFCRYNDMFASVYSLRSICEVLDADGMELLYMHRLQESYHWPEGEKSLLIQIRTENKLGIDGKLYLRQYILDNQIRFDPSLHYFSGRAFDSVADACTHCTRFGAIAGDIVPYLATIDHHPPMFFFGMFKEWQQANLSVYNDMIIRDLHTEALDSLAKTVYDAYNIVNRTPSPAFAEELSEQAYRLYADHKKHFWSIRTNRREVIMDCSHEEIAYFASLDPMSPTQTDITFDAWLDQLELTYGESPTPPKRRVAVYCGTENVYPQMVTAAKSLLAHNKMDQVYFLIETPAFPYPIPEVIQCIDVSGQQWFPDSCPNKNTVWSYMILMRGAFTKIFPDEDRILSLDNDTIVEDDISELFEMDMDDYYIAGVTEKARMRMSGQQQYLNFGVVVLNLKKLREDQKDDQIIASLNTQKWGYPEQGCYNTLCAPHILELDPMYNVATYGYFWDDVPKEKISHYVALKQYMHLPNVAKYTMLTWEEVYLFRRIFEHDRETMPPYTEGDGGSADVYPEHQSLPQEPGDPAEELSPQGHEEAQDDPDAGAQLVSASSSVLEEQDPLLLSDVQGEDEQQDLQARLGAGDELDHAGQAPDHVDEGSGEGVSK